MPRGRRAIHGHARKGATTSTFRIWCDIRKRCENQNSGAYHNYGGRGIKVCGRWQLFENFLHDMGERPKGLTLDRIDNDGDYEPDNCRWTTHSTQSRNTRRTQHVTVGGIGMAAKDAADLLSVIYSTISARVRTRGISWQQAFDEIGSR